MNLLRDVSALLALIVFLACILVWMSALSEVAG